MEHGRSWEAKSHSADQEIRLLWKMKFLYRVHTSLSLVSIINQMDKSNIQPYFPKVHSNIILHPCPDLPSDLVPSYFTTKTLYAFLSSPHTCYMLRPSYTPWFDRHNNIGEAYNLWSSSLCSHFQPSVTSFLSLSSAPCPHTLSIYFLHLVWSSNFTPIQKTGKIIFLNILIL